MIQIGSIVSIRPGSRYGLVKESFVHGSRTLFNVHYIDSTTRQANEMPDSRCDGATSLSDPRAELYRSPTRLVHPAEIEYLVQEGMIDPELLQG